MADTETLTKQAELLFGLGQYKEIIELLPADLLGDLQSPPLYGWRARAHDQLKEPAHAFSFAGKAIDLDPLYFMAYLPMGNAWVDKIEFDKAIEDYTTAINIKNDFADAYYARGQAWYYKGDLEKAIEDYTTAINLKPNHSGYHGSRGLAYEEINEFSKAIADYELAKALDAQSPKAIYLHDQLSAALGLPILFSDVKADDAFYKITDSIGQLPEEEQVTIMRYYKLHIHPIIEDVRKIAAHTDNIWQESLKEKYNKDDPKYVVHYSSLKVADLLVMNDKSKLRYSNAVFMNDPDEGKILIDYLDRCEKTCGGPGLIKDAFYSVLDEEKNDFYLGSFLAMIESHEDELLMWRTYGRDEHRNEATGCCMIIDVDFFDKGDGGNITLGRDNMQAIVNPLYKVLYYNQRRNEFAGSGAEHAQVKEHIDELKTALEKLLSMKTKESATGIPGYGKAIDKVLYHTLSELRYFFKSADYAYENELRVIQFATDRAVVKIDRESGVLPRKVYIQSSKEIKEHLKKIVLGPMVPHPERWMYLEKQMTDEGRDFGIAYSDCHFQ